MSLKATFVYCVSCVYLIKTNKFSLFPVATITQQKYITDTGVAQKKKTIKNDGYLLILNIKTTQLASATPS